MEENAWVTAVLAGDVSSFAKIVDEYQGAVFNLAYRMLSDREDAADAAQEVFLRIYRQLARYDGIRPFGTWLLSIAAHYCIDLLRKRRSACVSLELASVVPDGNPTPEMAAIAGEGRAEVFALLDQLSPVYRAIVVLRYWHNLSCEEIARTTDLSVPVVKTRLHRARTMLAKTIDDGARRRQPTAPGGRGFPVDEDPSSGESDLALRRSDQITFIAGRRAVGDGDSFRAYRPPFGMSFLPSLRLAT